MRGKEKIDVYIDSYDQMEFSKSEDATLSDDGTAKVKHYNTSEEVLYEDLVIAMGDSPGTLEMRRTSSTRERVIDDAE